MTEKKEEKDESVKLSWRDYVAIVIASFQTTFLPFIIVIFVLLLFLFMFLR